MRVTFLTHNYPRTAGDVAGAFLETLAVALVRRGTAVTVIAPSDAGQGGEETRAGVHIRRVRYASASRETLAYRGTMARSFRTPAGLVALHGLWRALRKAGEAELAAGTQLIHAHWWIPAGWASPPAALTVMTCHGTDIALLERSSVARMLARPVFRRAQIVTAVSSAMARAIRTTIGRVIDDAHVRPMPVPTSSYVRGPGGDGAIVIGRLSAQKRVHLAIEAIGLLRAQGHQLPLTIVGDGAERAALERLTRDRGLGTLVRFSGSVAPEEIPRCLARADVMLFTARGEGFGLAAAEAFMCGVPVVACQDGGGVLDIVPEHGGGRRAPADAGAIGRAAAELLGDSDARLDAVAIGERWRDRLSPDAVAAACEQWYDEALRG